MALIIPHGTVGKRVNPVSGILDPLNTLDIRFMQTCDGRGINILRKVWPLDEGKGKEEERVLHNNGNTIITGGKIANSVVVSLPGRSIETNWELIAGTGFEGM